MARLTACFILFATASVLAAQTTSAPPPANVPVVEVEPLQPATATTANPAAKIPIPSLAKRSGIRSMDLSPDGKRIASRMVVDGKTTVAVFSALPRELQARIPIPEDYSLEWYRWAGNDKLLISMAQVQVLEGEDYLVSRLMLYQPGMKDMVLVGKRDMGFLGDDLLYVDPDGTFVLLAIQTTVYEHPSVWRFPLDAKNSRYGRQVQEARERVWDWYADTAGTVRWGVERARGEATRYWYRSGPDDKLRMIASIAQGANQNLYIDVWRIVAGSDVGYVLRRDVNNWVTLQRFNFATRTPVETVAKVDGHDIEWVSFDNAGNPNAVGYAGDHDETIWLDPALKTVQTRLERAMKGQHVAIFSPSRDQSRLLAWVDRADDPGQMYIFDAPTRNLDSIYLENPALDRALLAKPRVITYPARDKTPISAYLTLPIGRTPKNLPLIILPHGGPYGVRDQLRFSAEVQLLANRGYAVIQPNYRGSQGYGEEFEDLGRGQIGRKMQDDLDDAMDWAVKEGIADRARVCMVGSSYGGYAALWAVMRNPERYRCAASFAGVTDWNKQIKYVSNFQTSKANKRWREHVEGSDEAFNLDQISPAHQVSRLTRPVLLAHGDRDTRVPFRQFRLLRDAAEKAGKPLELLILPDEGHNLDKEANEQKWYEALEAFLQKHNPPD